MVKKKSSSSSPMRLISVIIASSIFLLLGSAILAAIISSTSNPNSVSPTPIFSFSFAPDSENIAPIDIIKGLGIHGKVYLDNVLLGSTDGGSLDVLREDIASGEVRFEGVYRGRAFIYKFNLTEDDIKNPGIIISLDQKWLGAYTLYFSVNETGELLDGDVYLDDKYLGRTVNAKLETLLEELSPGIVIINGTHKDKEFIAMFNFLQEDLANFERRFTVSKDEIEQLLFEASMLNASAIEQLVFEKSNEERKTVGFKQIRWDDGLAGVAREYSMQMVQGGFHHTDLEGKGVGDRLDENKIFYTIAGENLHAIGVPDIKSTEESVADAIVQGWLDSPGHRSLLLTWNQLYSDMGVGVHCNESRCYTTQIFAGLETAFKESFSASTCHLYWIYPEHVSVDFNLTARVRVTADEKLGVYIIDNLDMHDNCLSHYRIDDYIIGYKRTDDFDKTVLAKPGYALLFEVGNPSTAEVSIDYRGSPAE